MSAQISLDKSEHVVRQKEEKYRAGPLGCSKSQWLQQKHHRISPGIWLNVEWDLLCAHNLTRPQGFRGVALKGCHQHQLPLFYFSSLYRGFQFSVHRALPGHERHNFYATVCLWFQRFATQEQGNEKLPKLPPKSNTLKAFTWDTGKPGAKIEKYKTCKWCPQDECGKLWNQEEQWKTNELQIFGSWSCF